MALQHQPDDRAVAVRDLRHAVLRDQRLQVRVLVGISVTAIDHHRGRQFRRPQFSLRHGDADRIVIDAAAAAAQHQVCVRISARAKYRRLALLRDAKEVMRTAHGLQRVDRGRKTPVRTVLKTHRCR